MKKFLLLSLLLTSCGSTNNKFTAQETAVVHEMYTDFITAETLLDIMDITISAVDLGDECLTLSGLQTSDTSSTFIITMDNCLVEIDCEQDGNIYLSGTSHYNSLYILDDSDAIEEAVMEIESETTITGGILNGKICETDLSLNISSGPILTYTGKICGIDYNTISELYEEGELDLTNEEICNIILEQ